MTKCTKKLCSYEDTMSLLPDDILIGILSSLTLKEAARTSVLSSRWINLWKHTSRLNFEAQRALDKIEEDRSFQNTERCNYIEWLRRVLQLHKAPTLKEFSVQFDLDKSCKKSITRWLSYAFAHSVERLELNLVASDGGFRAPDRNYTFRKKFLSQISVNTVQPPTYNFKPLKLLSFINVNVCGEVLDFFLHNCPFLEELGVCQSYNLFNLEVSGPSLKLKNLKIIQCLRLVSLKVSNLNLVSLSVGRIGNLLLENLPTLVNVSIALLSPPIFISRVPSLLSCCLLQLEVLTLFVADPEKIVKLHEFPELTKLKKLVLRFFLTVKVKQLSGLVPLIRRVPLLQEFVLQLHWYAPPIEPRRFVPSRAVKKLRRIERYTLQFLKVVTISGFPGKNSDFEFVRFFLDSAIALEKIIIQPCNVFKNRPDDTELARYESVRNLTKQKLEGEIPNHVELVIL